MREDRKGIRGRSPTLCVEKKPETMHMRPSILLTNDDGVSSIGLWAASEALVPIADVTVVAPGDPAERSRQVDLDLEPLRANQVVLNGVPAWAVAGKPTDAVIIGLYALKLNPTMVVSGIRSERTSRSSPS